MSGIEVAGLILGALPICVGLLRNFNDATDKVQRYRRWRFEIQTYQGTLIGLEFHIKSSLTILSRLAGLSEPDFGKARKNPGLSPWLEVDARKQLLQAHGGAYESMENDMIILRRLIEDVCRKLGLGSSFQTRDLARAWVRSSATRGSLEVFRERLTYALASDEVKKLFQEIEARRQSIRITIDDLESLMRTPAAKPQPCNVVLRSVRKQVHIVNEAVCEAIQCTQHSHLMKFQLDLDLTETTPQQQHHSFRICLASKLPAPIVFAEVSIANASTNTATAKTPRGNALTYAGDLCSIIHSPPAGHDWVGFHIDARNGPKISHKCRPLATTLKFRWTPSKPHSFISLREVLTQPPQWQQRPLRFMARERRILAIQIASYALVLPCTSWASGNCRDSSIEFLLGDCTGMSRPINYTRPFVPQARRCEKDIDDDGILSPRASNKDCMLLQALGAILIQLCLGEALESRRTTELQQQGLSPEYIEHAAIQMLKDQRDGDILPGYDKALKFCLRWSMDTDFDLDHERHLENAFEGIVLPLVEELKALV